MRKTFKKVLAMASAALMTLSMTTGVFAADKVNLAVNTEEGHEFTAYEVMSAEHIGTIKVNNEDVDQYKYTTTPEFENFFVSKDSASGYYFEGGKIYRIKVGEETKDVEIVTDKYEENDKKVVSKEDGNTVYNLQNTNETEAAKFAVKLREYAQIKNITGSVITRNENGLVPASVGKGYYLISETKTPKGKAKANENENDILSNYVASKPILVVVTNNTKVSPKKDEISLEKKIIENKIPVDANDVSIDKPVTYKVTTWIPIYEADVVETSLKFELTDTFKGLTFDNNLVLKIGDVEMKEGTQNDYTLEPGDSKFIVKLNTSTIKAHQGEKVVLDYSATLNADAVVNDDNGNPNKIELSYTNNPNLVDNYGYLNDEVKTYTYGFKIKKIDKENITQDMSGAEFTIKDKEGNVVGRFSYNKDGDIVSNSETITIGDENYASIKGLDEGTYSIEETVAPNGYVKMNTPVQVTIDAVKDEQTQLPTGKANISVAKHDDAEVGVSDEKGDGTHVEVKDGVVQYVTSDGSGKLDIEVKVANHKGFSLPETGAKTAMYTLIGGGLLLLVGGIFFVLTKKFAK